MWATLNEQGRFILYDGLPDLKQLQTAVGGYIEVVRLRYDVLMYLNEEGKLEGLSLNPVATLLAHDAQTIDLRDYIAGKVVFTGREDAQGDHTSLDAQQIAYLQSL